MEYQDVLRSVYHWGSAYFSELSKIIASLTARGFGETYERFGHGLVFTSIYIVLVLGTLYAFILWKWHCRKLRKVRPASRAQKRSLRTASSLYKAVKTTTDMDYLRGAFRKIDGFAFELFVLLCFERLYPNIKYIARNSLTGDGGLDGAILTDQYLFLFQSKRYDGGYVARHDIERLIKMSSIARERVKQGKRAPFVNIPKRRLRGVEIVPVLAITAEISMDNLAYCNRNNVKLITWNTLTESVRNAAPLIDSK